VGNFDEQGERITRARSIGVGPHLVLDACGRVSEHAGAAVQSTQEVVGSNANRPRPGGQVVSGRDRGQYRRIVSCRRARPYGDGGYLRCGHFKRRFRLEPSHSPGIGRCELSATRVRSIASATDPSGSLMPGLARARPTRWRRYFRVRVAVRRRRRADGSRTDR
jgi:hypothetical protein